MTRTYKYLILTIIFAFATILLKGQTKTYLINNIVVNTNDEVDPKNFHREAIEEILLDEINTILKKRNKQTFIKNTLLQKVASDQTSFMVRMDDATSIQDEKGKETTSDRLIYFGGSKHGAEIVEKNSISKGKIAFTYGKICNDITLRLFSSSKKAVLLESNKYNLIGISAKLNNSAKKVYISILLGNFKTFNEGVAFKGNLSTPYSEKYYGITEANPILCKRVNRMNNLKDLQNGLHVENNTIYLETDNIKQLKKVIRKKKDGLAVDVIQKEQFTCSNANIIDYNKINQGVLTKRIYASKLFKNNIANLDDNKYAYKASLGMLPEGIKDNYELNLVIIQNKSACKTLAPSFVINTEGNYYRKVELLADTITINSRFKYKPVADSMVLSVRIPFENKKYVYKTEDIEPFLKLLNEPDFIIYDLKITAYSSIEGSEKENKFLQEQRAKSIIDALKDRQKANIASEIITDFNWDDFKQDIQATKHNILASMSMDEAKNYIRQYNLKKELEPILANHRYAEIKMKVTFDISGVNEQPYVLKKFEKAIANEDRALALSIQKFIIKQVINNQYDISALTSMQIPFDEEYAGMEMNRLYVLNKFKEISFPAFVENVAELAKLNPNNEYIAFNDMLNTINSSSITYLIDNYNTLQNRVDKLYYTPLKKSTIDGLNIKYQFKLINNSDSITGNKKLKAQCIDKIKEIVNIKEETISNSLKLAEIFIENGDFAFARKSLEPWIMRTSNEKVIFTYVSLCSENEWLMHTKEFNYAMQRASELNKKRYCNLFNGDKFSLKVFENTQVKESYCKLCNSNENVVETE